MMRKLGSPFLVSICMSWCSLSVMPWPPSTPIYIGLHSSSTASSSVTHWASETLRYSNSLRSWSVIDMSQQKPRLRQSMQCSRFSL